ncbi:MAG: sulfotransferase family protein [Acidimicrobiia bacterium]
MVTAWSPWPRPEWVDALNATGTHVGSPAVVVDLEVDDLLDHARGLTGLDDFGGEEFLEPLRILLDSVERDGDLHVVGRILTRTDLLRVLINRLQIADEFHRRPELLDGPVDAPIFVTGTGRSGTSLLHDLLSRDASHRAPLTWEMRYPIGREPGPTDNDARRAAADRDVTLWNVVTPEYASMHTNGGDRPNECTFMVMHEFLGSYWMGAHNAPDYGRWLHRADPAPGYRYHRRFLQLLQEPTAPRRWVLKDPWHISALPALFAEYPDARVVVTHRDPIEVLPSLANLMSSLRWQRSEWVDRHQIVKMATVGTAFQLDGMTQLRDDGVVPADRIVDVRYPDLVADPVATLAATYDQLGLELTPATRERIVSAVSAPRPEAEPHDYAFEDLGVDRDEVRERFAPYRERYGV